MSGFDAEIVKDFLTESGELLERLDADLVQLETSPRDPELLNKVFRALHTIKGSASFLALTNLVAIAHAAEDALNAARKGEALIDRGVMDLLLSAVDLLRRQFGELEAGSPLSAPPAPLIEGLRLVGEGRQGSAPGGAAAPAASAASGPAAGGDDGSSKELTLVDGKAELFEFMAADFMDSAALISALLGGPLGGADLRALEEACDGLSRTAEFFELGQALEIVSTIGLAACRLEALDGAGRAQIEPRLRGMALLLSKQAEALPAKRLLTFKIELLLGRVGDLLLGHVIEAEAELPEGADAAAALRADGVWAAAEAATAEAAPIVEALPAGPASAEGGEGESGGAGGPTKVEQTIRVEVGRLEALLNLVGELVLQKNRVSALVRRVSALDGLEQELRDTFAQASGDLDRVTGDIQVAVMRTRMQALDRLFGKYPRLIRDLARKTCKEISLVIEGGDTEVDKSVIEELGDPLIHLLRNAADHGLETPAEREKSGKGPCGVIKLAASQQGDHVLVRVIDDGRGLHRDKIAAKAVEKGLTTAEAVAGMSDREVFGFIFLPGFSTAAQVSDLSGRGVGMDVVRTNIEKLKGAIEIDSAPGKGVTVSIRIPLTLAILPAMMVGVGKELYAVPLNNILEIVRPTEKEVSTVHGRRVMRLRDTVLPLVNMSELFDQPAVKRESGQFAVVVELNEQRAGLMVSRLIGQQEIVIKPLDTIVAKSGGVSGATVRDDGGVSLIVDIARVIAAAKESERALAA